MIIPDMEFSIWQNEEIFRSEVSVRFALAVLQQQKQTGYPFTLILSVSYAKRTLAGSSRFTAS